MPDVQGVLIGPFCADAADYEGKLVGVHPGATCGDVLNELAEQLGFKANSLALVARRGRRFVRLHASEQPLPQMQLKGVTNLEDLPYDLVVEPKRWRQSATLEEGLQIQKELIAEYTDEVFIMMMEKIRAECRKKWADDGEMNTTDYTTRMRPLLQLAQGRVLPKWGYEQGAKGIMAMQLQLPYPEIDSGGDYINKKLGFDYNWISDEILDVPTSKNCGSAGKLKILVLYGGGTNKTIAKMQLNNIFMHSHMFKKIEFVVLEAPHETDVSWHPETMQQQLAPFGRTIYLYFDRVPYGNAQDESWTGIDVSLKALKAHFNQHGPYDGVCGFDMGGEVLLQAACMAEQGVAGFQDMFRFMVLFTTCVPKHLSALGRAGKRPKAPLQIPAVISWSISDENHPYTQYEETCLFFAPENREVILHEFGHIPPRFKKDMEELNRLSTFLEKMWADEHWEPSEHPDNDWNRTLWLPLSRLGPEPIQHSKRRRLVVVHDPMGAHDIEHEIQAAEEAVARGHIEKPRPFVTYEVMGIPDVVGSLKTHFQVATLTAEYFADVAAGSGISLEGVEYDEAHRGHNWHCRADEVLNGSMRKEDMIFEEKQGGVARECAGALLRKLAFAEGDSVGFVGLGTGAFVALAMAKSLAEEASCALAGLWVVDAPTVLPYGSTPRPAFLGACPLRFLAHDTSTIGAPWRWEIATGGPFSMSTFKDTGEMIKTVVDEYVALCPGD